MNNNYDQSSSEDEDVMEAHYNKTHKKPISTKLQNNNTSKKKEILSVYSDESDSADILNYKNLQRRLALSTGGAKLSEEELSDPGTEEDENKDLDDWGPKKSGYYGSDDINSRKSKRPKRGREDAEHEETDAIRIQQETFEDFKEKNFEQFSRPAGKKTEKKMTKKRKSDPEQKTFDSMLHEEFERLDSYITEVLDPLLKPALDLKKVDKTAFDFFCILHRLYTAYQLNILFYQHLKSRNLQTTGHEVTERLEEYGQAVLLYENAREAHWEKAQYFLKTKKLMVDTGKKTEKKVRFADQCEDKEDLVDSGDVQKREITSEMLKNVGNLTSRSRKTRIPRTKNRRRYEKAVMRHRSQVVQMRDQKTKYAGEPTGIRSGVIKSTRFK